MRAARACACDGRAQWEPKKNLHAELVAEYEAANPPAKRAKHEATNASVFAAAANAAAAGRGAAAATGRAAAIDGVGARGRRSIHARQAGRAIGGVGGGLVDRLLITVRPLHG